MKQRLLLSLSVLIAAPLFAQVGPSPVAQATTMNSPAAATAPPQVFPNRSAETAWLRSGTPVLLKMADGLSTEKKKLRVGQRFQLEVAEPIVINGQIVIPIGASATGEVTDVKNKGMWGKSGKINARVVSVRVGDRTIRMTEQIDDKGTAGGIGAVAAAAVFLPVGFFVTGTSARIPLGAPVKGFVDEDIQLAFAATTEAPLIVPVSLPMTVRTNLPSAITTVPATGLPKPLATNTAIAVSKPQ